MRIDGYNLNAVYIGFSPIQTETKGSEKIASTTSGDYAVTLSKEAREAYEAYAVGQKNNQGENKNKVRDDFQQYMENARTAPKSKKEQIKQLKGKLEKLKAEMSEVSENQQMPEEVKKPKIEALNTQIQQIIKQIADLATGLAEEEAAESAAAG